jgi:YidC/Oxa1 family membrane protein insertase
MMTPPNPDPQQASMNQMMKFMPLMFGFFALQVPQGLVLYWVTSNLFSLIQQYFVVRWRDQESDSSSKAKASSVPASETSAATKRAKKDAKRKS